MDALILFLGHYACMTLANIGAYKLGLNKCQQIYSWDPVAVNAYIEGKIDKSTWIISANTSYELGSVVLGVLLLLLVLYGYYRYLVALQS